MNIATIWPCRKGCSIFNGLGSSICATLDVDILENFFVYAAGPQRRVDLSHVMRSQLIRLLDILQLFNNHILQIQLVMISASSCTFEGDCWQCSVLHHLRYELRNLERLVLPSLSTSLPTTPGLVNHRCNLANWNRTNPPGPCRWPIGRSRRQERGDLR